MKIENIERVAATHRELQHLEKVLQQLITADRISIQVTTWNKDPKEKAAERRDTVHIPMEKYDLTSIIQQSINNKQIELHNLGVDIGIDKTTTKVSFNIPHNRRT